MQIASPPKTVAGVQPKPPGIDRLVENRRAFTTEQAELNLYETYQPAEGVEMQFSAPLLMGMLSGRKVMQVGESAPFDFMPGQSLILPPNERMRIDFPDARLDAPTRCLALAVSPEIIRETMELLEEKHPCMEESGWHLKDQHYFLSSDPQLHQVTQRLIAAFQEQGSLREPITKLTLEELIIRLLQTQARKLLVCCHDAGPHRHGLAAAVRYIRQNLHEELSIEAIARHACMSRRQFFRAFRQERGISPNEFINQERIKRGQTLLKMGAPVKEAAYDSGFKSVQHFGRLFKKLVGCSPGQFATVKT